MMYAVTGSICLVGAVLLSIDNPLRNRNTTLLHLYSLNRPRLPT